ncbi:unnamed protein product [Cunninghamella blakesleeana]
MGQSLLHFVGVIFSGTAVILLILVNLGTTFNSTFLPKLNLIEATIANQSFKAGPYNYCISNDQSNFCTHPSPILTLDTNFINQLGIKDAEALNKLAFALKFIVLLIPSTVFALGSMIGWLLIREHRSSNKLPIIGSLISIFGAILSTATLTIIIVCYQSVFNALKTKMDLDYHWGPSLFLLAIGGCGCLIISFLLYVTSCLLYRGNNEYAYYHTEYDHRFDHNGDNHQKHFY